MATTFECNFEQTTTQTTATRQKQGPVSDLMLVKHGVELAQPFPGRGKEAWAGAPMASRYRHTHHQGPSEA